MLALENASLLEALAGLLNCTYLLNLFGVPTAAVDADEPVKPAFEAVTPEEGYFRSTKNMEEVLESRHLAVDRIAATPVDRIENVEELTKVDNEKVAEVPKMKSGKDGKKGKKNKCGNIVYIIGKEEKVVCAE